MSDIVESGTVPVAGGSLYYERFGHGTPLVLIHSAFLDHRQWDPQFRSYSEEYLVLRYDLRGNGRSSKGDTPHDDVEDLRALLDFVGIPRCFLVGNSKGAGIAAAFAAAAPERVMGLVMIGGGPGDLDPTPEEEQSYLDSLPNGEEKIVPLAAAGQQDAAVEAILNVWAPSVDDPTRVELRTIAKENLGAILALLRSEGSPGEGTPRQVAEKLRHASIPTLLIVGDREHRALQMMLGRFAQQLPRSNFVTLADADHTANRSNPEEFDRVVLNFLTAIGTSPSPP
jgi:2-hydroxy-6-oxonona-2,4-dienedioate hydrolase